MEQDNYNSVAYYKPGFLAGFVHSTTSRPATVTLLLRYYCTTVELLLTCLYRGLTRLQTRASYGIAIPAPSPSLPSL